jgi:hypothetical protein
LLGRGAPQVISQVSARSGGGASGGRDTGRQVAPAPQAADAAAHALPKGGGLLAGVWKSFAGSAGSGGGASARGASKSKSQGGDAPASKLAGAVAT